MDSYSQDIHTELERVRRTASVLYFINQGDIRTTAMPNVPVLDLAGALGSTGWGLWVAALGISLLLRRPTTEGHAA
jgi:hypothetical protein